ncbi:MAG: STAS domain-containing protein [Prevotella sp.]|nr:STAS domain-containing protein [Prevotella sp.]
MNTTIKEQDNNLVAYFEGRLDTAATPQTERDLMPLLNSKDKDIILDCTKLEYISSSGLRLFLNVLKNAKPKGVHVCVTGMNANIRSVFTMTGFMNLFEIK